MMRTSDHQTVWPRISGALALVAYLVLLFHAHVHVAIEAHALGDEVTHSESHPHDSDHEHTPHPASEHELSDSTACLARSEQLFVHDFTTAACLVFALVEEPPALATWIEDRPKHPPPRRPGQPRSPPTA